MNNHFEYKPVAEQLKQSEEFSKDWRAKFDEGVEWTFLVLEHEMKVFLLTFLMITKTNSLIMNRSKNDYNKQHVEYFYRFNFKVIDCLKIWTFVENIKVSKRKLQQIKQQRQLQ